MAKKIIGNNIQLGQLNTFVLVQEQDGSYNLGIISGNTAFIGNYVTINGSDINFGRLGIFQGSDIVSEGLGIINAAGSKSVRIWIDSSARCRVDVDISGNSTLILNSGFGKIGLGLLSPQRKLDILSTSNSEVPLVLRIPTEAINNLSGVQFAINDGAVPSNLNVPGDILITITQATPSTLKGKISLRTNRGDVVSDALVLDENGNALINGAVSGTNAVGVLSLKNGTAPTTGPVDTVQFYSSDDAAGHTIPSFYCEGTNVVAIGQADIASSVRVKMRINGTVRTFLCV